MFRLYEYSTSGNCYKVRLLLTQLHLPFERIEIDIVKGESRTPEFLKKNSNGRVPVLELETGKFLPESNAILFYLSQGTEFFPEDRFEQTQVLQWMFFEQYSHEPYIATSRYWIKILGKAQDYQQALEQKRQPGYAALQVMENHLETHRFFVGDRYTIADISLFAYTHVAEEGDFKLTSFPAIQSWIKRLIDQSNYIPMDF
ncbi:glutathione S-transferase family protein [Planktothrix sp. FACHB-1365]|uniref:glutathione S-transferase family protein n=1 Tax=Planktothrix sp. FACHB-1365 TaxID=2692855 RepID=UPI0016827A28|nr:glutathione S-transferase family protein [Planktothrix sp. FACHB-1365]MBD2483367.1 glutathione S-transferase family protein [Planktothrix sp. FACHB-1365]